MSGPPPPPPPLANKSQPAWKKKLEAKTTARVSIEKLASPTTTKYEASIVTYNSLMDAFKKTSPAGILYKSQEYERNLRAYVQAVNRLIGTLARKKKSGGVVREAANEKLADLVRQLTDLRITNIKMCEIAKSLRMVYSAAISRAEPTQEFCDGMERVLAELRRGAQAAKNA